MVKLLAPRFDFGLRSGVATWKRAFRARSWAQDLGGGFAAIGLTLPLAVLLATCTGVPLGAALASSVVGSGIAALAGGNTFALSGPGIASAVAIAGVARQYGPGGLALACLISGGLQVGTGALGLARFVRLVPVTVVQAFVAAVGGLVFLQALPLAVGRGPASDFGALQILDHLLGPQGGGPRHAVLPALAMASLVGSLTVAGRRFLPRLPVALLLLALAALGARLGHLDVATLPISWLDDIPNIVLHQPAPPLVQPLQFAGAVFTLFAFASIETLLSLAAEEERPTPRPQDPDQELIGQGATNLALGFLGGMMATASVLRATALRQHGAVGPAAALVHAVGSGLGLLLFFALSRFLPWPALAAVVMAYALPLLDPRPWLTVWRVSRRQAGILAITLAVMLVKDVVIGVETGIVLSLLLAVVKVARARAVLHRGVAGAPHQVSFSGPLTFLSAVELGRLGTELRALGAGGSVILDMRNVMAIDLTGCRRLLGIVAGLVSDRVRVALLGAAPQCRDMLLAADTQSVLAGRLAVTDKDVDVILGREQSFELRAHVVANLERFRSDVREHYVPLFEKLADNQHPHTLFIGCVDSRVTPAMLTGTHPGDLFVVRCLGAMVAPPGGDFASSEAAAIEYAVGVLGVHNIVVCGHSGCGAVRAATTRQVPENLLSLRGWLTTTSVAAAGNLAAMTDVDEAARLITVRQLDNLHCFPVIAARLAGGDLLLHAWFYDVGKAELFEWQEARKEFVVLSAIDPEQIANA